LHQVNLEDGIFFYWDYHNLVYPLAPCSGLTCQNGGQCGLIAANTYGCVCVAGYTGAQCENIDLCMWNNLIRMWIMKMIDYLAVHPCVTMPGVVCKNSGTCAVDGINYKCNCGSGWTGVNCETAIATATSCNPNPCTHGTCIVAAITGGTIAVCTCDANWTGKYCDVDMSNCLWMNLFIWKILSILVFNNSRLSCWILFIRWWMSYEW